MELLEIRNRWNDILDALLAQDRIAWLAFDARLAHFDGKVLTLDFRIAANSEKPTNFHRPG